MGHLAVAQGKDVNKGSHEQRSACFSFAPEFTQDKHPIPSVNELLGDNRELLVIRGNGGNDLFGYCLHPPDGRQHHINQMLEARPTQCSGPKPPGRSGCRLGRRPHIFPVRESHFPVTWNVLLSFSDTCVYKTERQRELTEKRPHCLLCMLFELLAFLLLH